MKKRFVEFTHNDFLALPCWNTNFSCFEGLDSNYATFKEGVSDAYSVLIEDNAFCMNSALDIGSFKKFMEKYKNLFELKYESSVKFTNLEQAYFIGVLFCLNIFQSIESESIRIYH